MSQFDPQAYGPLFAPLLAIDRRRPLDAGQPNAAARPALEKISVEAAFAHAALEFGQAQPADRDMAACCIAAVWLLHDYLDESHHISQEIDTPSGSFWHGIMHRREGDFSNAKYWFRRVGRHPVLDRLGQRAAERAATHGDERAGQRLVTGGAWDPFAFVDLCESAVRGQSRDSDLCRDIQQDEWEQLFDQCYKAAVAK